MLYGKSILYCTIYMYRSAGTAQKMRSVANQQIFVRDENNATVFFFYYDKQPLFSLIT